MTDPTIRERYEIDWNNDDEILNFIEARWRAKDWYKGGLEKKWLQVIASYEGFPYLDFDEIRQILFDGHQVPEWRVNLVVNLLLPKVRTIAAKQLRNRPIFDVLPATSDIENINRAQKSKKSLQSFWYSAGLNYDFISLLLWLGLTGNAFFKVSWNPNIGPEYEVSVQDFINKQLIDQMASLPLGDQQKKVMILQDAQQKFQTFIKQNGGTNYSLGEVEVTVPTPFDILFPYAPSFKYIPWLIESTIREISYYIDSGLDPAKFVTPTQKEARFWYYARRNHNLFTLGYDSKSAPVNPSEVLELQLWMPKSKQFKQGFFAVVAGGYVIEKGPNPFDHREIPYIHFKSEETPGKAWGFSSTEMAKSVVDEYQRTKSQVTEMKNLTAKPKWICPRTARILDTAITSEPGEVIEFSGLQPPSIVPPPSIPPYVLRLMEADRRDIDDIMAIHDASIGINPSGSRSGLMNVNLQEQDEGQLAIVGLNIDTGLSRVGRLILSVQNQFYKEDRLKQIVGEKHRFETFVIGRGSLAGSQTAFGIDFFNVRVVQFSQFGLSRVGQLKTLETLLQYNVFKPNDRDKIFKFLQIGFVEDSLDEFQIDRTNAHVENLQMTQGSQVAVDLSDEDKIHIEEHVYFQKGDEYKQLHPQLKSVFQKHIQDHKLYAATKIIEPSVLQIKAQMFALALNQINPQMMETANGRGTGKERDSGNGNGNGSETAGA